MPNCSNKLSFSHYKTPNKNDHATNNINKCSTKKKTNKQCDETTKPNKQKHKGILFVLFSLI